LECARQLEGLGFLGITLQQPLGLTFQSAWKLIRWAAFEHPRRIGMSPHERSTHTTGRATSPLRLPVTLGLGTVHLTVTHLHRREDFVAAMAAGRKIASGDASKLIAGADEAKACVRDLQAQTPTTTAKGRTKLAYEQRE
jgi:hypothetical protein